MGILSGIAKLAGKAFGLFGDPDIPTGLKFQPDIKTPSFRLTSAAGGNVDLTRTAFPQRFGSELANLAELRGEVRPGFGRFTEAGIKALERSRGAALGTAREQLQRRRIQGSSFGAAQLTSIEQKFAEQEETFRADAILREINTTFRIIDEEFKVKTQNLKFELDELGLAINLTQTVLQVASDQARIDKANAVLAAQGEADFASGIIGDIFGGGFGEDSEIGKIASFVTGGGGSSGVDTDDLVGPNG